MRQEPVTAIQGQTRSVQHMPHARQRLAAHIVAIGAEFRGALQWKWVGMAAVVGVGTYLHAMNLRGYPRYQLDEGTYIASAWATAHGHISPYTYTYGHPPLGWALIALWLRLTGGFFSFGTAVDSGRACMVWVSLLSAVLVYLIMLRLTNTIWPAMLATAFFAWSPLSVTFQREVLLDNIATLWMLVALYFLVGSQSRLKSIVGSGAALGLAFLSKETMVVVVPAFAYGAWLQMSHYQRRFALIVFTYVAVALVSLFPLVALLKGELFPSGTFLGGSNQHVSMITTFLQQAGRGSDQGSFSRQWGAWWGSDAVFMFAGMVALGANLLLGLRNPSARILALITLSYWLFLARGGVTLEYYLLPLIPLQALNIALLSHAVSQRLTVWLARSKRPFWHVVSRYAIRAVYASLLVGLTLYDVQMNFTNLSADAVAPEVAAIEYLNENIPRSAVIVANNYVWVDLHAAGGLGSSFGAPFGGVQMYWEVATDPAIRDTLLHNDWNTIDYVLADSDMMVDVNTFHMAIIAEAIQHAVIVKTFSNRYFWVTLYRVQHLGAVGSAVIAGHSPETQSGGTPASPSLVPASPATTLTALSNSGVTGAPSQLPIWSRAGDVARALGNSGRHPPTE